jgi:hypothetical protein
MMRSRRIGLIVSVACLAPALVGANRAASAHWQLPKGNCQCKGSPQPPQGCQQTAEPIKTKAQECQRINPANSEVKSAADCGGNNTRIGDFRDRARTFQACRGEVQAMIAACKSENARWKQACEQARERKCQ